VHIHHIGHASYLFETVDRRILMDPVFFDPFEAGANVSYPRRTVDVDSVPPVDLIILSHRHFDHYDLRTLALFNRNVPCIIPQGDEVIQRGLRLLGYTRIREVPPGAKIRLGATTIVTTPSKVPFPEMGVIIQDETATVWNCVDSVIDQPIVKDFTELMNTIDCVLATYNPLIQFELRSQAQQLFPFERYRLLIENVVASKPHVLVPSACGLRYPVGAWQNHLGFPMTPERFLQDVKHLCPSIEGVHLLPGDCLTVFHHEFQHLAASTPFVQCNRMEASADCAAWIPDPAVGIEPFEDKNPLKHSSKTLQEAAQKYIEEHLLTDLQSERCRVLLKKMKRWHICWQLDLYVPFPNTNSELEEGEGGTRGRNEQANCPLDTTVTCNLLAAIRSTRSKRGPSVPLRSWYLDFSQTPLRWCSTPLNFVNMHTAVAASGIVDAFEGNITFYSFNFTDRYRYSQRIYQAQSERMTAPKRVMEEPLSTVLASCYDIDLRYIEKQAAHWQEHDPVTGKKSNASVEKE